MSVDAEELHVFLLEAMQHFVTARSDDEEEYWMEKIYALQWLLEDEIPAQEDMH